METRSAPATVLGKVTEEAKAEIVAIMDSGLVEAEAILSEAEREATMEARRMLGTMERLGESRSRQIIGSAELEARNVTLRLIEKKINEVLKASLRDIRVRKSRTYGIALKRMLAESIDSIASKSVIVSCCREDRAVVEKHVGEIAQQKGIEIKIAGEHLKSEGGVEVRSPDGSIVVGNTLENRLERMRADLRKKIAESLQK